MTKYEILKQYYGYDTFREGQEAVIDGILAGRDALGIMPTGAGKSICYQVPSLLMEGITIVVSPLISLMKDQVHSLNQMGVHAAYFNSSLTYGQYLKALEYAANGRYQIIYVAPERLLTEPFLAFAMHTAVSMVSVDEAHCISQWGQDFRPSYLKIAEFIRCLPKRPIISAFTATATKDVKEDIICILGLQDPVTASTGFDRKNLYFAVEKPVDKAKALLTYLAANKEKSGIIYCSTRKKVEEVSLLLNRNGYKTARYHAGLADLERKESQEAFTYDEVQLLVATNAFGMGIDKSNVRFIIHYNMPKNMESYYQEAGRAGRDGLRAECILYYAGQDVITAQFLIEQSRENQELSEEDALLIKERDLERLRRMTYYCHTTGCCRDYILRYFGEYGPNYCGSCSNCLTVFHEEDISEQAYHILSCSREAGNRYGVNTILDTLRGSKNAKVLQFGLDKNSFYGRQEKTTIMKLRQILNYLTMEGYMQVTDDKYPLLITLQKGSIWMDEYPAGAALYMKFAEEQVKTADGTKGKQPAAKDSQERMDKVLFELLREMRTKIAKEDHVPPYIVFSDRTLNDMCLKLPMTQDEMLAVHGVGQNKLERYGGQFIGVIQKYQSERR